MWRTTIFTGSSALEPSISIHVLHVEDDVYNARTDKVIMISIHVLHVEDDI